MKIVSTELLNSNKGIKGFLANDKFVELIKADPMTKLNNGWYLIKSIKLDWLNVYCKYLQHFKTAGFTGNKYLEQGINIPEFIGTKDHTEVQDFEENIIPSKIIYTR